jgi:hypothetical protein
MRKTKKLAESVRSTSARASLTTVSDHDLVNALGSSSGDSSGLSGPAACGHYDYPCPA